MLWAAESGIVQGVDIGVFAPERNISRQEMAVMLSNYAAFKGIEIPAHRVMPNFADLGDIASWALAASSALAEAGVLSGSDNRFNPQDNATRAEVAQMFKNFLRFVVEGNEGGENNANLPTATLSNTLDAIIDRRAQYAIQAALMPQDDEDDIDKLINLLWS